MPRVYVGIGTNIERDSMVRVAVRALQDVFGRLNISRVVETPAWGFEGDDFYNLVVAFESDDTPPELKIALRKIENAQCGETGIDRFAPRKLDLDLLLVGDQVFEQDGLRLPRDDVLKYPFVLCPLSEIAGDSVHPVLGKSFRQLWQDYDKKELQMKTVEVKL